MQKLIFIIFILLSAQTANASLAKDESIRKLLEVTQVKKMIESSFGQWQPMFNDILEKTIPKGPNRKNDIANAKKKFPEIEKIIQDEYSYEKLEPEFIKIYQDTFSEEEVQGTIQFYESPVGASIITKMPIVMQKSMGITQSKLPSLIQKITQVILKDNSTIHCNKTKEC